MAINLDYIPEKNPYSNLVETQKFALLPSFTLDSGCVLHSVELAYKTWGRLSETADNVLVLCHALSGSSDAEDWWRPLMGRGKTFDYDRFFIFAANILGSPYGSASPLTINPDTGNPYGPGFPRTTIRDDVRIQKMVLDALGVQAITAVIGGSMGGMAALEWPLCTEAGYVKSVVPITTSAYHSSWGVGWGESQRQCIFADNTFQNGWYIPLPTGQPKAGLGAARMVAMLTYRSPGSFETRFHRRPAKVALSKPEETGLLTPSRSMDGSELNIKPLNGDDDACRILDGSINDQNMQQAGHATFATQSYLQYQADKFLKRFDANCYIHLTHKMDTHDVTWNRLDKSAAGNEAGPTTSNLKSVLKAVPAGALVISVETDILFRHEQQVELAQCLPNATFTTLDSPDGHDGFLLEFAALGKLIKNHLRKKFPRLYEGQSDESQEASQPEEVIHSVFGEAEPEF